MESQNGVGPPGRRRHGGEAGKGIARLPQRARRRVRLLLAGGLDDEHAKRSGGGVGQAVRPAVVVEPRPGRGAVGAAPAVGERLARGDAVAAPAALRRVGRGQGERAVVAGGRLHAVGVQAVDAAGVGHAAALVHVAKVDDDLVGHLGYQRRAGDRALSTLGFGQVPRVERAVIGRVPVGGGAADNQHVAGRGAVESVGALGQRPAGQPVGPPRRGVPGVVLQLQPVLLDSRHTTSFPSPPYYAGQPRHFA